MTIENLPEKFQPIWDACVPLFKEGRPGDAAHAKETVEYVLAYDGPLKLEIDVMVPVGMMHDIGHAAILPEHIKHITGPEQMPGGKLVHMLTGAKIAHDILKSVGYDTRLSAEIVDIISTHDYNLLKIDDARSYYDTENKKIFHDIDSLDRYSIRRMESVKSLYPDPMVFIKKVEGLLPTFFFDEFRDIAEERLARLKSHSGR